MRTCVHNWVRREDAEQPKVYRRTPLEMTVLEQAAVATLCFVLTSIPGRRARGSSGIVASSLAATDVL
jgi:hypothetical protein